MCLRAGSLFVFGALLAAPAALWSAEPVRVLVSAGTGDILNQAKEAFDRTYGAGLFDLEIAGPEPSPAAISRAHLIFWYHPETSLAARRGPDLERASRRGAVVLVAPAQMVPRDWSFRPNDKLGTAAEQYWQLGGLDNITSLLAFLYRAAGGAKQLSIPRPTPQTERGIYHPKTSRQFSSLAKYLEWYGKQNIVPAGAPLVAITFYQTNIRQGDLAHIDALITELERNGIGAVPAFGWPFFTMDNFLTIEGQSPLRLILALNLGIVKPDDSKWLAAHGVHALNLQVSRQSYADWSGDLRGLSFDAVPHQVAAPERAATAEPLLIASTETKPGSEIRFTQLIPERIVMAVRRAKRWLALQDKPNRDKRIVFVYYNNPPGKGNLGASYLQVLPTMATMLERLAREGYSLSWPLPDAAALTKVLERSGRNVETWAPGELQAMLDSGGMALFSVEEYKRYYAQLPRQFREMVTNEYGPPEKAEMLRVRSRDGKDYFLIPGAQYGNFFLGVQPLRSTLERAVSTTHDTAIPVPHSYVAAYLWYRFVFHADAIVHIGRHGTLEWLPGKQVMQAGWDHSEALLGDMPNPYLYIMDGDGEALQAMRRSAGVMMSHLTPLIVGGGEQASIRPLKRALEDWSAKREVQPELAELYRRQAIDEARKLKLEGQLNLNLETAPWPETGERLMTWVGEIQDGPIPAGIHELGKLPSEAVQREALAQFLKFGLLDEEARRVSGELPDWAHAIFEGRSPGIKGNYPALLRDRIQTQWAEAGAWIQNLRASPQLEVEAIVRVLAGRYLPPSPLGDPLRTPAGLPTGRKQFGFDPTRIPTKAAWELGGKMADETLARYSKEHGRYPEKVSMVLWYGETERHHGAMESMALHLMGVEPQWNAREQVDGLRLVPDAEMTHPRVDVIFHVSGIYRDGFGDKIVLLDRAARLAASAGNNVISKHDREVTDTLVAQGVARDVAKRIGQARAFGNKPGAYNIGVNELVEQSRDVDNAGQVAGLYLHNMNYAFTEQAWGDTAPHALASHMKGNQAVLFSRTSNLYAALDNDDVYSYVGGLSFTSKHLNGGESPAFYIHNLRKPGSEHAVDLKTWLATELNQRNWNPKWIAHMKESGYAGAREMNREIQHLYGFQATAAEHMDGSFWQNTFDVYVADKYGMDLEDFFEAQNPHARQDVLARLLEVDRQGSYRFSEADRGRLVTEYVHSVVRHGVACSANICGNQRLQQAVAAEAVLISGLGPHELRNFGRTLAKATHWNASAFRRAPAAFRAGMAAQPAGPATARSKAPSAPPHVEGFAMEQQVVRLAHEAAVHTLPFAWPWAITLLLTIAAGSAWEARQFVFRRRF